MDYMFFSSLEGTKLRKLVVSYDIACQWSKKIWERMSIFPHSKQVLAGMTCIVFVVPKFHLPAHIKACNIAFSFNLTKGVGRTDGEAPERGWADANRLAGSTKEMGPGSRRDTLDDHFNDWNWKKIIALGESSFSFETFFFFDGVIRCRYAKEDAGSCSQADRACSSLP